jgi:hypothetical protein
MGNKEEVEMRMKMHTQIYISLFVPKRNTGKKN